MNNHIVITIENKKHSFRFGMGAWEKFCQIQGIEFGDIDNSGVYPVIANEKTGQKEVKYNPFAFKNLLYAAYLYNCEYEEIEPELNKAQASEILDYLLKNLEIREKVFSVMFDSLRMDLGDSKKKVTPKKG